MSKKKKAKELTPEQHQARFDAAAAAVRREYCNMFEFWRACRYKLCPKARVCSGDARAIRCRMRYETAPNCKLSRRHRLSPIRP